VVEVNAIGCVVVTVLVVITGADVVFVAEACPFVLDTGARFVLLGDGGAVAPTIISKNSITKLMLVPTTGRLVLSLKSLSNLCGAIKPITSPIAASSAKTANKLLISPNPLTDEYYIPGFRDSYRDFMVPNKKDLE
jgi:hypothetical protein